MTQENVVPPSALEESVQRFCSFFEEKLGDIQSIGIEKSGELFQKVLYNALLDALSKSVASPKKGNRERLVSLVRRFSSWDECDRVSLPHLVQLLQRVPDPEFSKLREYAFSLYDKWSQGTFIYLDKDPSFDEVKKVWPSSLAKPVEDICLESLQHLHLFYSYRNSLIHEFREAGHGMEMRPSDVPFYHGMIDVQTENFNWELEYPVGFFRKLCETILRELRTYYVENRIDPYACYTFGSSWISVLNA